MGVKSYSKRTPSADINKVITGMQYQKDGGGEHDDKEFHNTSLNLMLFGAVRCR
jgi:hypothetical protein